MEWPTFHVKLYWSRRLFLSGDKLRGFYFQFLPFYIVSTGVWSVHPVDKTVYYIRYLLSFFLHWNINSWKTLWRIILFPHVRPQSIVYKENFLYNFVYWKMLSLGLKALKSASRTMILYAFYHWNKIDRKNFCQFRVKHRNVFSFFYIYDKKNQIKRYWLEKHIYKQTCRWCSIIAFYDRALREKRHSIPNGIPLGKFLVSLTIFEHCFEQNYFHTKNQCFELKVFLQYIKWK